MSSDNVYNVLGSVQTVLTTAHGPPHSIRAVRYHDYELRTLEEIYKAIGFDVVGQSLCERLNLLRMNGPTIGTLYLDLTNNHVWFWNGNGWVEQESLP